ncbi:MAG: YopX family protein [Oscillospiraceae bacterium]|nr:YopX family protein [Oscillospiraceae bacterium]
MDNRYLFRGKIREHEHAINGREKPPVWAIGSLHMNPSGDSVMTHYENSQTYSIDPATIGQCTGLRAAKSYRGDKPEDLLIFEGDIVRCISRTDSGNMVVIFERGEFRMVLCKNFKAYKTDKGYYAVRNFEKEIIGNIHDNPELLEV